MIYIFYYHVVSIEDKVTFLMIYIFYYHVVSPMG